MSRIPTLDGWRGIAILLVIIAHWQAGVWGHPYHDWAWLNIGGHGVAIFFVLSGYLITSRLFHEDSLKRFYIRRIFRLWPVAWAYLGVLAAIGVLWKSEALACVLFYRNFVFAPPHERGLTGHFWSLSIEEQFYMVWPAVLFVGRRRALWFALAGVIGFGMLASTWPYAGLFLGCTLAFATKEPAFRARISRHDGWLFPICVAGFLCCVYRYHDNAPPIEQFLIAAMLACSSLNGYKWLEWKPLAQIGAYSYSLYVWQEIFLITHSGGLLVMFLPLVAIASYHFIEQPSIRLGARLLGAKTSAQARLSAESSETVAVG
jgi:peptidoglycan/LPS O-acetylase OafA/YrhL